MPVLIFVLFHRGSLCWLLLGELGWLVHDRFSASPLATDECYCVELQVGSGTLDSVSHWQTLYPLSTHFPHPNLDLLILLLPLLECGDYLHASSRNAGDATQGFVRGLSPVS